MVMLLTMLTVAFMMRAGSEKQSSGFYRAEATTRDLSDTTLNLVEGAINEATTQGITYTWTSQPGVIRVFDNTGASYKTFKLYSAPSMSSLVSSVDVSTFIGGDLPPANWYTQPGMWVDLNAPVNSDPNPNSAGLGSPTYTHFPILDPRDPVTSTKTIAMDGFALPPVTSPQITIPFDTTKIDNNNLPNPAPMPVQWLYVLQDGTLTAPNGAPDASGNYTLSKSPSAINPIIGRIAFWTDDETCKVNVNTAGADGVMTPAKDKRADPSAIANGAFWSPPYFAAPDDASPSLDTSNSAWGSGPFGPGFCTSLPSAGEYQRYPGHPATVALSNILNTLAPAPANKPPLINTTTFFSQSVSTGAAGNSFTTYANNTFTSQVTGPGITPRYVYGGSQENTVNTFGTGAYLSNANITYGSVATSAYRLYPSLSETLFHPDRTATTSLNTASASDTASRQRMETGRFFLTAHSRAPELNLFGLPRVSIWPMSSTPSWRTPTDNLIGFCTTIGGTPGSSTTGGAYYFTRSSSYNSTVDIGLKDSTGYYRNALILSYLDYLTRQNIPGFGGNFYSKDYATGSGAGGLTGQNDQILTEIFDYVRATNIQDVTSPSPYGLTNCQGTWQGIGQVVPSLITSGNSGGVLNWNTQGFASYPRLVEATLQFVAMGRVGTTATGTGAPGTTTLTTSAVVSPSEMLFANSQPGYLGVGDPSSTLTYPHPVPPALPTLDLPYAAPGTSGGAPATGPYDTIYPVLNAETGLYSGIPPDGTNAVQAFIILTFINPAQDWIYCAPYVWTSISGQSGFALNGHALGFSDPDCMVFCSGQDWHGGGRSGYTPIDIDFQGKGLSRAPGSINPNPTGGYPFFSNIIPITSDNTLNSTMTLTGTVLTIKLYDAPSGASWTPPAANNSGAPIGGNLVQTYSINFPSATFPVPVLPNNPSPTAPDVDTYLNNPMFEPPKVPTCPPDYQYPPNSALPMGPGSGNSNAELTSSPMYQYLYSIPQHGLAPWLQQGNAFLGWVTPNVAFGSPAVPYTFWWQTVAEVNCFEQSGPIIGLGDPPGCTNYWYRYGPVYERWNQAGQPIAVANENYIGSGDVLESMVLSQVWNNDPRMLSIANVPTRAFVPHPNWGQQFAHNIWWGMVLPSPGNGSWLNQPNNAIWYTAGKLWPNTPSVGTLAGNVVDPQPALYPTFAWAPCNSGQSDITNGNNYAPKTRSGAPPDWDSGCTTGSDGPWLNKADEGSGSGGNGAMPYYANPQNQPPCLFTANREVCSPGMLGSLPTGVDPTGTNPAGWQTLLFRPGPGAAGYPGMKHPGEGNFASTWAPTSPANEGPFYTAPPDHLWMDLFWIPITEPYAISEPMSTAGKINLNYQILPFTYIKRATALRAAMATEKIAQVGLVQSPTCKGNGYQQGVTVNNGTTYFGVFNQYGVLGQICNARYPIDLDVTLSQFDYKFNNWDVFRSASQICDVFLVPMDVPNTLPNGTASQSTTGPLYQIVTSSGNYALPAFLGDTTGAMNFAKDWYIPVKTPQDPTKYTNAPYAMIGDNLREQPYAHLYSKLTTKSNTFTVYYRVQSLKKPASVTADWNENLGTVTGEYRGSTTIERFIDPNEKVNGANVVPDAVTQLASNANPTSLEAYYKWRVVENHQFAP